MARHREGIDSESRSIPLTNVRVLRGEDELAAAVARAEEGARRLHDRLAARAARDTWMAEHTQQRVQWLRFVRSAPETSPIVKPAAPVSATPRELRPPAA